MRPEFTSLYPLSTDAVFGKGILAGVTQLSAKRNDPQEISVAQRKHWSAHAKLPAHPNWPPDLLTLTVAKATVILGLIVRLATSRLTEHT